MIERKTPKCPKCEGTQIYGKSIDRDHVSLLFSLSDSLTVETSGGHTYPLVPKICTKCGYVEFYVMLPKRRSSNRK